MVAQGRSNIAPNKIPWELIRILITETYGGKIDDDGDFNQLSELINRILTPSAFDTDHKLVNEVEGDQGEQTLSIPDGNDMKDFMAWVQSLPEREPPTYLGLPSNAEKLLLVGQGQQAIDNLTRIIDLLEESEQLQEGEGQGAETA